MSAMIDVVEFIRAHHLYRSNRRLSRPEFLRRRLERFREFAAFVGKHSPYYRQIIEERRIDLATCEPEQFPVLTKSDIVEHFDEIVTAPDLTYRELENFAAQPFVPGRLLHNRYIVIRTSGTSGLVAFFVYDPKAWARAIAGLSRAKGFNMINPRRKRIAFIGKISGYFAGVTSARSVYQFPLTFFYELKAFEINRPLRETTAALHAYQPDIVVGYGGALRALAERQLEGEMTIKPEVVTNSGEALLPADKRLLERTFGKCIRNFYTCSEHMFMGLKEAWHESMCLFEDELIIDIHEDHTLVTNIYNRTLPLIRYRMTDILVPVNNREHYPYQSIGEVVGRLESQANFKNVRGTMEGVSPYVIHSIAVPCVRQFQVRIRGFESFDCAVVLDPRIGESGKREALDTLRARWTEILAEKGMSNVTFEMPIVDEIPPDPKTGKFSLVVKQEVSSSPAS